MDPYLNTCREISRLLTNRYSTSFSLGIRVFPRAFQDAIYSIYGFVRVADEIVDTFNIPGREKLFNEFCREVDKALDQKISTNPILHAFQSVFHEYGLDRSWVEAFLRSMEMDLAQKTFSRQDFEAYVYGSAEVIGLMCLKVFCGSDEALFSRLMAPARDLGAAFQKVNFLRDMKADWDLRGRIYMPDIPSLEKIDEACKNRMQGEIKEDLASALKGIRALPAVAKLPVYSVFLYYEGLFQKIQERPVHDLLARRLRVADARKLLLLLKAVWQVKILRTC